MSTFEEFEAAPVGATATSPYRTVVKTGLSSSPWVSEVRYPGGLRNMERVTSEYLVEQGFTLDPAPAVPTSACEALDLAWELAHPVREGQVIPEGTFYIRQRKDNLPPTVHRIYPHSEVASEKDKATLRTMDPIPDQDWLDAPAVLASTAFCDDRNVWEPAEDGMWACVRGDHMDWQGLRDVTPLYPKGQEA